MKTAAVIIIGNEVLSGKVADCNSPFLASELRELGVELRRIAVIPDDIDVISREVADCSSAYDFVFTSGGVGPTHDDVTMEGVARAFGVATVANESLLERLCGLCDGPADESVRKMAEVPEGSEIVEAEGSRFPPVVMRNVYIFPGIPEYLKRKFYALKERFRSSPFVLRQVYLSEEECVLAPYITEVAARFPMLSVGSYPKLGLPDYKVIVTIEGIDAAVVDEAVAKLVGLVPMGSVVKTG